MPEENKKFPLGTVVTHVLPDSPEVVVTNHDDQGRRDHYCEWFTDAKEHRGEWFAFGDLRPVR